MNSTELQKQFPEIYRDFFSKNDLVMSGCFSFPWGPRSIGNMSDQIILKSRIPLKCYVGLKKRKDNQIVFQEFLSYSPSNSSFSSSSLPMIQAHWNECLPVLSSVFGEGFGGYDISILSEIEKGHSFGFSGTLCAILATTFFVASHKIDTGVFSDYTAFMASESFRSVFLLAWKMEFILKNGNSIGQTIMTTLENNSDPSLYYIEHFDPKNASLSDIDAITYKHSSLREEFSDTIVSSDIPLDYYILFSGISANTKHIEQYRETDKRDINEIAHFMNNRVFSGDIDSGKFGPKNIVNDTPPYEQMNKTLGILNMMTLSLFEKIFRLGYDSSVAEEFVEHINHLRYFVSIIESQSSFAEDFKALFVENRSSLNEVIGIMPGYSGKHGGGYVVVTKPGISQGTFTKTVQDMKKIYPSIEIEYASYKDGISKEGISLEQYLSESIFSPYVKKGTVVYKDNTGNSYMGDYRVILSEQTEGLFIDSIERKVYFNGEKLTSKDVPSQSTTVDVLEILLDHVGEDIENSAFPASSYVNNKNEMIGKIIIPLVRFIEEKASLELPLVCKGGISDFYLKLNSTELKIGMVKKID